jgi:hypothetical protein
MQKPPLDADVADTAPSDSVLTVYDEEHLITYLRLLDADAEGADWREVARIVLHLDPEHESDRARRAYDSHLSRAKWMTKHGLPAPATRWRVGLNLRDLGAVLDHEEPLPHHPAEDQAQ